MTIVARSLVILLALTAHLVAQEDHRHPAPDRKTLKPELVEVRKVLKDRSPREAVNESLRLARLQRVKENRVYAFLEEAKSLAVKDGYFDGGATAVEIQVSRFQVDIAGVTSSWVKSFNKGRRSPRYSAASAEFLVSMSGRLVAAGDLKAARKLVGNAKKLASKQKLKGLASRVGLVERALRDFGKVDKRIAKAAEEAAVLDTGLAHLMRGDASSAALDFGKSEDEELRALAELEAGNPARSKAILDLAEAWWQLGAKRKSKLEQSLFRGRALQLARRTIGRVNSEQQERLAAFLREPAWTAFDGRLGFLDEDGKEEPADFALFQTDSFVRRTGIKTDGSGWRTRLSRFPDLGFTRGRRYLARIETNLGEIIAELHPEAAPAHVSNFIYLTRLGFYDGLSFHRVIPGFMAQGGCPLGTGNGGPGYKFDGELETCLEHDRTGVLSMAHSGPGTDGAQFFLTFTATSHLDGKHTAFGRMITGRKTLGEIEKLGSKGGDTAKPVKMERVTILVL